MDRQVILTDEALDDLERVLNYYCCPEMVDFMDAPYAKKEDHIFRVLQRLNLWLKRAMDPGYSE